MKVLFVFNKPLHVLSGGIERVTASIMSGLSQEGIQSFYLQDTGSELLENESPVDVSQFFAKHGIDVVVQQLAYEGVVSRYLKTEALQIPYIVAWHTAPPTFLKSWRVATTKNYKGFLQGLKRLLRIIFFPVFYHKEKQRFWMRWNAILSRTSRIVLLSPSFFGDFQRLLRIPVEKLFAIPNPLSFDSIVNEEFLFKKEKEVLIVSRMKELQKRISIALRIWKKIEKNKTSADWQLKIIGDGEDLSAYQKMAQQLRLQRVQFLGSCNPRPYYEKAALSMMTSAFEGWGLTLTESQQFGTVPLAFNSYASAKDIVQDGENGYLIPYGDEDLYSNRLLLLMKNLELRKKMALKCLQSAHRFEIQNVIPQWKKLLFSVTYSER